MDREALRALADLAALAITVARTREQERSLLYRLQGLDRASTLVSADLEPARILRNIVQARLPTPP